MVGFEYPHENPFLPRSFDGEAAYFAHSYHFIPRDSRDIAASITHGNRSVAAVVARDKIIGMQFHPEKSLDVGLEILEAVMAGLSAHASLDKSS